MTAEIVINNPDVGLDSLLADSSVGILICIFEPNHVFLAQQVQSIVDNIRPFKSAVLYACWDSPPELAFFNSVVVGSNCEIRHICHLSPDGVGASNFLDGLFCCDEHDFYAWSDQDDIWFTFKLRHSIESMVRTNSMIFSSNSLVFGVEVGKARYLDKIRDGETGFDFLSEAGCAGSTYVFNHGVLREFKEKFGRIDFKGLSSHDHFFYVFARLNEIRWHMSYVPTLLYRIHSRNVQGIRGGPRSYLKRLKFLLFDLYQNTDQCFWLNSKNFKSFLLENFVSPRLWLGSRRNRVESVVVCIVFGCHVLIASVFELVGRFCGLGSKRK